jgi:hypothetical protein
MTRTPIWSRRAAVGGLGALALAPGLVDAQPPPEGTAPDLPLDRGAQLESAFDQAARMAVPVRLNGQGPFTFVVDTGANSSVVSREVAEQCRLPSAGFAPVHGILMVEPAPMVRVARFQVGDVRSTNLRLPLLERDTLGADGLLGLDMLRGRRMTLDFAAHGFDIAPSGTGPAVGRLRDGHIGDAAAAVTVPARFRSGQLIIVDASVAGRAVTAFLDSGSQVTVANRVLKELVLTAQPRLGAALVSSTLISATGQRAQADFGPLPGLRIGRMKIETPLVAFADLHIFELWKLQQTPSLLVGVDLLRRFDKVAFDYGRKELTFWPPARSRSS